MKPAAALLGAYVVAATLSLPFTDVPVIDDWAYAYSVDQMLQTGQFRVLEYSCRYNLVQVLWGAMFSLPAGVSFVALRLSTFVLGALGVLAFYDLLRRRTGSEALAAWTAALLAFNPLYFRLSLSFMTDVPLLAMVAGAFWLLDAFLRSGRLAWLVVGVTLAVAGYLVRELAIVAPVAMLVAAAMARPRRISLAMLVVVAALVAAGLGAELWWIRSHGATWGLQARTQGLRHLLEVPWSLYAWALLHMLLTAAAFVAPAALATLRHGRDVAITLGGAALWAVPALVVGAVPFGEREVLSPLGLGMTRALMPGAPAITQVGEVLRAAVFALACGSLAVLSRELVAVVREGAWRAPTPGTAFDEATRYGSPRELKPAEVGAAIDVGWILFGLGQIAALMVLWLWQDRYDLVLLPSALWLVAVRAMRAGWNRALLAGGVTVSALLSVLGTRDDFELNRAAWEAEAWLRQQQVAARDIDGGYILNGWRLYAYADDYAPGYQPERVPFLFSKDELAYAIAAGDAPSGEIVRTYRWPRTWLSESRLYAVRR